MKLDFGEHSLEITGWASQSIWRSELHQHEDGHLVLGQDTDHPEDFWIINLTKSLQGKKRFGIGIVSEGHGLVPHFCIWFDRIVVLGFNREIIGIDANDHREKFRIDLPSLFVRFIPLAQRNTIHVLHEIGWLAIDGQGRGLWEYSKDIVVGWEINDEVIRIDFMDSPSISLNASTGRPMPSAK